jgi:DNA-binding MarR family transcriptional regulator
LPATPALDAKLAAALERVGQALRVQARDAATPHGLTPTQAHVLLRLAADPPVRRRIGALSEYLDVSHPTVSDAVSALSRKGLVERAGGGRRAPLALTASGADTAAALARWDGPTREQLARLPTADKQVALRVLLDLVAGMQAAGVVTVARMCSTCRHFRRGVHPGETSPHHCALVDLPLADADLRVDCAEHAQATGLSPARMAAEPAG